MNIQGVNNMTLRDITEDARTLGFKGNISHINQLVKKVYKHPDQVYDYMKIYGIMPDSVIREKIFTYISDKYYNGEYQIVYSKWLGV